ncbi:unnamed protein product [Adineta steineri]|uniref:Ubiquitin thioesterase OTU n=1 Tax=Adineta steineri TaxID=433720 RepID=A0A819JJ45_9BILA|nr:unnamed protein product [Adineta steineri]
MFRNNDLRHNLETPESDLLNDFDFDTDEVLQQGEVEYGNSSCIIGMNTEVNTPTEQKIKDNDGNLTMFAVTTTTTDNQISSNVTTNISETTYTLRRKEVPGDGSCLYWSFLFAKPSKLTVQGLRDQVAAHVSNMDIDDIQLQSGTDRPNRQQYCNRIRKGAWAGGLELEALSQIYHIMIKVIILRKDQQQNSSIDIMPFGKDDKSCIDCIYIVFDEAKSHYEPLYLCNIKNLQDKRTIFNRDNILVDFLLPDFIKRQIDSNHLSKGMTFTDHMLDESVHMLDSTVSKNNSFNANEQYASANNIISRIQNVAPIETYEFRVGELPGDDQTLYVSVVFQFDRSKMTNVKCLRKNVAHVIRSHTDNNGIHVPPSLDYQNREDYCLMVAAGIISGSEPEFNGLKYLYPDILFCIISKPNMNNNAPCIDIYVKDISSYKKCIIILYDEDNNVYMPLYLHNKINDEEEKTNFKYDDTVKNLLREFIKNKLNYSGYVNFDGEKDSHAMDSPSHVEHEPLDLAEMITENHSENKSEKYNMKKRKAPEITRLLTSSRLMLSTDQISPFHEEIDISVNIETFLQSDMLASYDSTITNMMEQQQQQMEGLSTTVSKDTSVAADDEQMRFETEPAERFRGRALSDYVPKSETKRDGTKAKPRNPSYFADRINQHFLNLLIPTRDLFADLRRVWIEIALVTRNINGCIYLNPLFDFLPYKKNGSYGDPCNPMLIKLEDVETYPLTKYTDELQKLMLKLVVIMCTNAELVKKQPMKVFKLDNSNGQTQETLYKTHDTFKKTFQLNDVYFAITLCTHGPDDEKHQRHLDTQYISEVSRQDNKVKLY